MKNERSLSILMIMVLLFTSFVQPLVIFGEEVSSFDEDVEEMLLDGEEAIVEMNEELEEPEVKEEPVVEEVEVETEQEKEPVKNKGDPVFELSQEVDGKKELKIKEQEEFAIYNKFEMPKDLGTVDTLIITVNLNESLEALESKVLVGEKDTGFEAEVNGQTVTLKLDLEQMEGIKGEEVVLGIKAFVKEGTDQREILNDAMLEVNDHELIESNKTKVIVDSVKQNQADEKESIVDEDVEVVKKNSEEKANQTEKESVEDKVEQEVEAGGSSTNIEVEELEQDDFLTPDIESSVVADYEEKEENVFQRSLAFFSFAKSSAGKDISEDVKVSNLKATPNSGSEQVWETQFGKLGFDLSLPDSAEGGDTFVVKIKGINSLQDFKSVEKIVTADGRTIGEFSYKRSSGENILTGTLYDEINNKINVSIKMDLGFKIDESYRGSDTPESIKDVSNDVMVYTKGSSQKIQIKSKLFNILTKFTIFNNIHGNENAAEIETVARISSNERTVNSGTLTFTPVKGFTIPKDPKIGLQGWVYTKQDDGTYKVGTKRFEIEVVESKKNKLVIKTPKLVNSGDKIELLRVAVDGVVNNPSKIDYSSTNTDTIQVKGEFNSSTAGYKDLTHIGNSNLYFSESIGADAEEFEASIRVIKQDKETKDRLEGAVFEVRDEKGKLIKKLTTDKNGEASIGKLSKGKYTIIEVEAPKGYKLSTREETINVKESKEYVYKVDNEYQPRTPNIIKDVEGDTQYPMRKMGAPALEVPHEKPYEYNVKTHIPKSINGYKDLTITDVLDNRLNVLGATVLVDGKQSDFNADIKGQTVTLKLNRADLEAIKGKEVNVQITASIKTGTDIELIDNKATIQLNDNPNVDSNIVTVVPPVPTTPDVIKDVEGKDHLEVAHEKAYNYNVKTNIPTELGGYEDLTITDVLDERLDVVDTTVLVDGKASDFEAKVDGQTVTLKLDRKQLDSMAGKEVNVQITAKIQSGTDIELIDNKATIKLNDNPEVDSNVVTVVPPVPTTPDVIKDVEGKDHLEVAHEKAYNYNVKTNIPTELGGYEDLTITDVLDKRLDVVDATVLVDGKASDFEAKVDGQTVTLKLDREQLDSISGKEVNVQITAKIQSGTDIELIDNKATIKLNDNPEVDSNVVTVVPPVPTTPDVIKDVEGKDHLEVAHEKAYNYNVKTNIPTELGGYEDLTITDKLDSRLDVVGTKVLVDGKASDFEAKVDGQTVTLKLDRKQLDSIAGKEVNVQITAKIKSGTDIELIDNKATIQLNDNPEEVDSNVVTVIPPVPTTPDIIKDVEGKGHLEVAHEKAYNYNVKTNVPTELGGYKDLTITDVLDKRLSVLGATVLVDGEESDFEATIKGQTVTLKLDREQLDSISGKEINLQITAKIQSGTDIELIDNKATIKLNDNPEVDSNVVTVVPPVPTTPDVIKDVEGKDHLEVAHEKAYNYNVKTNIPTELGGYEDLTITDVLDERLDVVDTTVFVDGKASDFEAKVDGQTVTLKLDREQLDSIAGKEINLQITAKIQSGTDIELIDNKATIQLNDNPNVDSNIVTVVPPVPTTPDVIKDVEGKDHLEVAHEKAYNYNVKTNIPTELGGYEDLTITDVLDKRLDVVDATVLVNGKTSDFEAKVDGQTVTLKLDREQLDSISGKEINLQITAKIQSGTDIELIDNKATIQLNDNPKVDSNVVTVVPPVPTTPDIIKDVEGKDHLEVAHEKAYNYNVKTNVPTELGGYKDLTLTDVLDERLDVVDTKVLVDGKVSDFEAKVDGQTVTLKLDRKQLDSIAGKEVNLQITAKIQSGTDIELIDNKATIQLNDNPSEDSNVVTVIPLEPVVPTPTEPEPKEPVIEEVEKEVVEGKKLPKTATDMFNYLLIGLGFILLGVLAYFFFRKKEQKE